MAALDLRFHEVIIERSDGRVERVPLTPNRSVAAVTVNVLSAVQRLGGPVEINPIPQETAWRTPLAQDEEHATYELTQVELYFAAATRAALVLAELRAPTAAARLPSTRGGARSILRWASSGAFASMIASDD